jgi:hypothetical protein
MDRENLTPSKRRGLAELDAKSDLDDARHEVIEREVAGAIAVEAARLYAARTGRAVEALTLRLIDRLEEVFGNDGDAFSSVDYSFKVNPHTGEAIVGLTLDGDVTYAEDPEHDLQLIAMRRNPDRLGRAQVADVADDGTFGPWRDEPLSPAAQADFN